MKDRQNLGPIQEIREGLQLNPISHEDPKMADKSNEELKITHKQAAPLIEKFILTPDSIGDVRAQLNEINQSIIKKIS